MIYSSNLTSKGQVTIPKILRDKIGIKPGQEARFELLDDHTLAIRRPLTASQVRELIGSPRNDQPLTSSERANIKTRGLAELSKL